MKVQVRVSKVLADHNDLRTQLRYTVKSQAEASVTIQEIKSLGVLQAETCY